MADTLRSKMIKLAATMPKGSSERKALLDVLATRNEGPHPLDPRKAIVYFDLIFEDYNVEEDAEEGDSEAQALLDDPRKVLDLESKAVREVASMFKVRISNEGHGSGGELVCKFDVNTYDDVRKMADTIRRKFTGDDDMIDLSVRYFEAGNFRLYPQGVNRPAYGVGFGRVVGDLDDWLDEHK